VNLPICKAMKKVVFVFGLRTLMWPKGSRTAWWERMWFAVMRVESREVMFFIIGVGGCGR